MTGALAGLPVGPAAAALMATGGAVVGSAADLTIDGNFTALADSIADKVPPGGAMIVAQVAGDGMSECRATMQEIGGTVIQ